MFTKAKISFVLLAAASLAAWNSHGISIGQLFPVLPTVSCGASQPTGAAAVGYNRVVLCDTFPSISEVDVTDSLAPGFNWYIHNAWPNMTRQIWANFTATPGSSITVSGNQLMIAAQTFPIVPNLLSAGTSKNSKGYVGKMYGPAIYIDIAMSFDRTLSQASEVTWPGLALLAAEGLLGLNQIQYMEGDIYECQAPTNGNCSSTGTLHNWLGNSANGNISTPNNLAIGNVDTNAHHYGFRILPSTLNAGVGSIDWYFDGALKLTVTYSPTGPSSGAQPSNPNGTFSSFDTQHYAIWLQAGQTIPVVFYSVTVWQP